MTSSAHRRADLPGTTVFDGRRLTGACVRALTGSEEVFVADTLAGGGTLALGDDLLAGCTRAFVLETGDEVDAATRLDLLTVGDREALLLRLRQVTFGDTIDLVVSCPDAACGATMDLRLSIDDLCRAAPAPTAVPAVGVEYRLPTVADLRAVAAIALDDPDTAARLLATSCIVAVGDTEIDEATISALSHAFAIRDPHADIELACRCPECGCGFATPLDAAELLRDELLARSRDLDVEVHLLAFNYHWALDAILSLPSDRRRRYADLLVDALRVPERE
jgi:hypothetical protein